MADIEEKLDILIKAYMQDRERLLALPLEANIHSISYKNNPPAPPPPPGILTSSNSVVSLHIYCMVLLKRFNDFDFSAETNSY